MYFVYQNVNHSKIHNAYTTGITGGVLRRVPGGALPASIGLTQAKGGHTRVTASTSRSPQVLRNDAHVECAHAHVEMMRMSR